MKPAEVASNKDFVQFLIDLRSNVWKLVPTLEAASAARNEARFGDWCNVNTSFVALFSVLTGQEKVFSVLGAPGHVVGALYGMPFDFPNKESFKKLALRPMNKHRSIFLEHASDFAESRKPHQDSRAFRELLSEDRFEEAKALFDVLFM